MTKTIPWLLTSAAVALCAGTALAAAGPAEAVREAEADARAAAVEARKTVDESREAAMEAPERALDARQDARERAREAAERARQAAERAREAAMELARQGRELGAASSDIVHFSRGQGRAEYLARALQLRPDQQPALTAFLEATKRRNREDGRLDRARADGRTTLQRLDDMQARMAEQQAEANRRIAAVRTFYGQLDATQKKAFDSMPMLMLVGPSIGPMVLPGPMPIVHVIPRSPPGPVPPGSL